MADPKLSQFSQIEAEILKVWDKEKTFQKSLDARKNAPYFSFYDGPPFANGLPHYGHVVPGTIKDAIARYKTMLGFYVPRKAGWDTHGLPVEYEVEKQLGISGKKQILAMGVDKFNDACRASVFKYRQEFEDFIRRSGRWLDLENAYATLDNNYIESVWWVVSELHQKELLYQTFRSMPYCPRCATPLSNFELNLGYQDDVEDPSVYVLFPLKTDAKTSLLAWTTTPWTLPANAALAVDLEADYVEVELRHGDKLVLAKSRLAELDLRQTDYKVIKTFKGKTLVGLEYEPLYNVDLKPAEQTTAYRVYGDKNVSLEDGTGILHVAPRYGETDLELGQKEHLPLIESVDSNGLMTDLFAGVKGMFFKKADWQIIADLTAKERIFAAETFKHTYPFCWRCDTPLMYFATPTWNVKVPSLKKELLKNNDKIKWVPEHIKTGRFGNWLAEARDWGISRNRFWGAPLPIWACDKKHVTVVGSIEQLEKLSVDGKVPDDLHRPFIDDVKIKCLECSGEAARIEEVLDCWFESGAMPYAQDHYPFENKEHFKKAFPADFISEGLDQTRGWFYTLHVLATALFDSPAYKNVICHGIVVAADGKKLSKRLRNYPPLEEVFTNYGADILRFFMLNSPVVVGEDVRFSADHLKETQRNVFMTWWNVFSFFKLYADVDHFKPTKLAEPKASNVLDRWILARLNETITEVTKQADLYRLDRATRPIVSVIDDLSNWYVRRSRRRFWKSEDDKDKQEAYETLWYVLVRSCQLLAPWSPFLPDKMYRELTAGMKDMPESVHLTDWPKPGSIDPEVIVRMLHARAIVNDGLSQRANAGIKARQPLSKVTYYISGKSLPDTYIPIIADELNVKKVICGKSKEFGTILNTEITHELKLEGLAREVIRHVQQCRKEVGLNVDDRIYLELETADGELKEAVEAFSDLIMAETLATKLGYKITIKEPKPVDVDGARLEIAISKQ